MRTVDGEWGDDYVNAGPVRQSSVHHRRRFIHAPSNRRHNLVNDVHQVRIVLEHDLGFFQNSCPLDVHFLVSVDQDVADGRILQQRF